MFKLNNKDIRLTSVSNLRLNQRGYAEHKRLPKDLWKEFISVYVNVQAIDMFDKPCVYMKAA